MACPSFISLQGSRVREGMNDGMPIFHLAARLASPRGLEGLVWPADPAGTCLARRGAEQDTGAGQGLVASCLARVTWRTRREEGRAGGLLSSGASL